MKTFENPKFRFLKKLFLDFPELRLGRAGKYADICILSGPSFFIPCNTESKTSAPRQTNCTKCFPIIESCFLTPMSLVGKTQKFNSHVNMFLYINVRHIHSKFYNCA